MRITFIRLLSMLTVVFCIAFPVQSQTSLVPGGFGGTKQAAVDPVSDNFENIMRKAAESGVSVIVIDTKGKVLSNPSDTEALNETEGEGASNSMTGVMKAQISAVKFREILIKRLRALPGSFKEVEFI